MRLLCRCSGRKSLSFILHFWCVSLFFFSTIRLNCLCSFSFWSAPLLGNFCASLLKSLLTFFYVIASANSICSLKLIFIVGWLFISIRVCLIFCLYVLQRHVRWHAHNFYFPCCFLANYYHFFIQRNVQIDLVLMLWTNVPRTLFNINSFELNEYKMCDVCVRICRCKLLNIRKAGWENTWRRLKTLKSDLNEQQTNRH